MIENDIIHIIEMFNDLNITLFLISSFMMIKNNWGWTGYPVQYPVSSEIRPFFSYPVSGWIPDIEKPDIQFPIIRPDIRQTAY